MALDKKKTVFPEVVSFMSYCERMWYSGQAEDDRHMRVASWVPKATDTHSEYVILIAFHCNKGYKNASQCYVIRTLSVCYIIPSMWSVPFRIFDQHFVCPTLIYGACPPLI